MSTGENEHGLRAVIDLTRLLSIAILLLHFYRVCHPAFEVWGFTADVADRIIGNLSKLPVFANAFDAKLSALVMLCIFLTGIRGKKDEKAELQNSPGLFHFGVILILRLQSFIVCFRKHTSNFYGLYGNYRYRLPADDSRRNNAQQGVKTENAKRRL